LLAVYEPNQLAYTTNEDHTFRLLSHVYGDDDDGDDDYGDGDEVDDVHNELDKDEINSQNDDNKAANDNIRMDNAD
jgi:hypothetical protein